MSASSTVVQGATSPSTSSNRGEGVLGKTQSFINKHKRAINLTTLLTASVTNSFTFLNNNFDFVSTDEGTIEKISNFFAKLGVVCRGLTGSIDCWTKNNLLPLIGWALEVPVALFTDGYNLWLGRGIAQGEHQSQAILKRRGITFTNEDGQQITMDRKDGDNFAKYGLKMGKGFVMSLKECCNITKEFFTKPFSKGNIFTHSMSLCSSLMIVGPVIAFAGLQKIGAFVRDLNGALVDVAYMLDPIKEKGKPSYVPGGVFWIGSAAVDFLKRFDYFTTRLKSLTQLSLAFDGIAAIFESNANFWEKPEVQT